MSKFDIPNLPQSPDIGQNSDGGISDFQISSQFLKEYCFNSNNIVMKLRPATKPDKWKKATSKKLDDDIKSGNFDTIGHFPIYGWFGTIGKLDSGCWIPDLDSVIETH